MFTGVENCARTPPILLPVDPFPCELSRSITSTFLHPACVRCQAMLEPTIPPPIMTTSAVCMLLALQCLPLLLESLRLGQSFFGGLGSLGCGSGVRAVYGDNELRQIADHLGKRGLLARRTLRLGFTTARAGPGKFLFIVRAYFAGLSCGVNIFHSLVRLPQCLDKFQLERKLLFQILRYGFNTRIHGELERLSVSLAINRQPHLISARKRLRTCRLARNIAPRDSKHAVFGLSDRRSGVTNVPQESMHSGCGRQQIFRLEPIGWKRRWSGRSERLILARVRPNNLAFCIQYFKFYFTLRG